MAADVAASPRLPSSVLFVCTQNAVRSVMAASLMRQIHGARVYVQSAGVRPDDPDPFVAVILAERGLDVSRHEPRSLEDLADSNFDLIITLSPEAHHRALEFTRTMSVDVEYWPTEDPTQIDGSRDQKLEAYRMVLRRLEQMILKRFPAQRGPVV